MTKRRVGCDTRTEQRTRFGEINGSGNAEDEVFVNDDEC